MSESTANFAEELQMKSMVKLIDQLTNERDELKQKLDEENLNRLGCEYAMTELRRCCGLDMSKIDLREVKLHIDGIVKERDQLAAQLKELQGHICCMYCNEKYTAEQSKELADHILSCDKSPLVQMNAELMEVANLIIGSSDPDSVIIEAEKRIKSLPYNPILKQRDDALDKLKLSEAQVVQLMDENNSLKLDYSHSEAENAQLTHAKARLDQAENERDQHATVAAELAIKCDEFQNRLEGLAGESLDMVGELKKVDTERDQLAAKCAEMRWTLQENLKCHIGDYGCPACKTRIEKLLASDQCGVGWLSPDKAGKLREALRSMVTQLEQEEIRTNFPFTSKLIAEIGRKALEACK